MNTLVAAAIGAMCSGVVLVSSSELVAMRQVVAPWRYKTCRVNGKTISIIA